MFVSSECNTCPLFDTYHSLSQTLKHGTSTLQQCSQLACSRQEQRQDNTENISDVMAPMTIKDCCLHSPSPMASGRTVFTRLTRLR